MTSSAEGIRSSIKWHSHYGPCLNGSRYSYFCEQSNKLDKCIDYYSKANRLKEEVIEENNKLKIKEKEANKSREIADREYESIKENYRLEEDNEIIYNENILQNLEKRKKNEKINAENTIENLEKEIENLKQIIEELKNQNTEEEEWRKEEILNSLQHEYELKIQRYKEEKEIERIEKEEKIKEMENQNKIDKEVEFAELRNSSDFVNKLIYLMELKNFNINNSLIQNYS